MKLKLKRGGMLLLTTLFLFHSALAQGKVLINEILPNPTGSDKGKEFIELYNNKDKTVEFANWLILRTSKKGIVKKYVFREGDSIGKKKYLLLQVDSLNNDGAKIELFDKKGEKIDQAEYQKSFEGKSYNRNEKKDDNKWYWAKPTPKQENDENPINKKYPKIQINEIYPNPTDTKKADEFIELYNSSKEDVDLQNWQLRDASKTGKYTFKNKTIIKKGNYLIIERQDFKFALNNSGQEKVILLAPNSKINDNLEYQGSKKGLSYSYNYKTKKWKWTQYLTLKKENKFNHQPTFMIDIPKNIFIGQENKFVIKNLEDIDGDQTEIIWNFGDKIKVKGGRVKHIYTKPGEYTIRVTISDGVENIVRENLIKVDIPALTKLSFVKLLPNPEGADTGREIVSIKNNERKGINLKGYKIATGSTREKIVKHTILQDVIIKPGQVVNISNRTVCKFILTNKRGVVQLLMPDGRVINEVEYSKDSILPNQEYVLEKNNQWHWNEPELFSDNHLPTFKIKKPKNIYRDIYAEFKIKKLHDTDRDKLKVVWDFGDGHKSYLKKTRHKYGKTGKYKVSCTVKDGKEKVVKTFKIKVKKYPKYKLQIIGLMPNPDGKDQGNEFIILKNNGKKKINLFQYKIATGHSKKKLTGHPFYKNFIIKAGETRQLFNKTISKFSLLNKVGIVQLLYPNGKVADEVKYSKNKILPNEQYLLNKQQQWYWWGGTGNSQHTQIRSRAQVLGIRDSRRYIDITLNYQTKMCETTRQIKITNWQANKNGKGFNKYLYILRQENVSG